MDEEIKQRILSLAAGNPGAIKVLKEIHSSTYGDKEETDWFYTQLENAHIEGSQIWVLYSDVCHSHLDWFLNLLIYRTPDQLLALVKEHKE